MLIYKIEIIFYSPSYNWVFFNLRTQ